MIDDVMIIEQTLLHNALYAGQGEDLDDTEGDVGMMS